MTEITAHHGLFKVTNLHVHDTGGSGRPVVLVHGWPLSGEAFSEQVLPLVAANGDAVPPAGGAQQVNSVRCVACRATHASP